MMHDSSEPNSTATLVGELRRHRPDADEATLTSLARALERPMAAVRASSPGDHHDHYHNGNSRDRLAIGRSVAQVLEESCFEGRIVAAFLARSELKRKKLVLVVDDAVDVLVTLGAFLEGAGFEVVKASGADAAVRLLSTDVKIDAIVTDVAMPGMSGVDLILQARELRPDLPAIVVTAFADPATLAALPATIKVLRKPFRRSELVRCVHDLVDARNETVQRAN